MALAAVLYVLVGLCSLGSLVCFIMVVVKMFQNDQSTLGIVCIVLAVCTGIGGLVAFIFGWMNAAAWNIRDLMKAWTACIVAGIVFGVIAFIIAMGHAVGNMPR